MPTLVGTLLNADKVSIGPRGDPDCFLTLLELAERGMPLLRNHCPCCVLGEVVDVMLTADGRTWAVATTDLPRERCEGLVFSLGGRVMERPPDLSTPRPTLLEEVSLVERSGSTTTPVRWQPHTISSWNRGGWATGTTAVERQVLDAACERLTVQERTGIIEVTTLPDRHPAPVVPMTRSARTAEVADMFRPQPFPVTHDRNGRKLHTRYFPRGLHVR